MVDWLVTQKKLSIDISKFSFQYLNSFPSLYKTKRKNKMILGDFYYLAFLNVIFFFFAGHLIHSGEELFFCPLSCCPGWAFDYFRGKKFILFVCFFFRWKNLVKCAASNFSSMCVQILHVCIYDFHGFFFVLFCIFVLFFSFIVTYSDYSGAGWCFGWCQNDVRIENTA